MEVYSGPDFSFSVVPIEKIEMLYKQWGDTEEFWDKAIIIAEGYFKDPNDAELALGKWLRERIPVRGIYGS